MAGGADALAADRVRIRPAFLEGFGGGRRFGLWVEPPPAVPPAGAILCVQPFGDEATLARRVLCAQAARLALRGWTTLIVDPFGTGDSDGATDEATLARWRADLLRAAELVRERVPGRFVLWGTRMGALLAVELAVVPGDVARPGAVDPGAVDPRVADTGVAGIVLWQAPASGAALIDPLRKLSQVGAVARSTAASSGRAEQPNGLTGRSEAVDARSNPGSHELLAGYRLRRDLVDGLAALELHPPAPGTTAALPCPTLMLAIQRVLPAGAGGLPKGLTEMARRWREAGHAVSPRAVQAEPFWSSLEPSTPVAAFEATEAFLDGLGGQ